MTKPRPKATADLHKRAYAAMDRGALSEASRDFEELLQHRPDDAAYHYMRGLVHKYRRDWNVSLHHNLRAIELAEEFDAAAHWNAAIAATALSEWTQARKLWSACGIELPPGDGPISADYGVAVVRLNPWHGGETVWMRRLDPVRARLLNVPLPESGHRFGDIVLHDGASTGERYDARQRKVPVFNELALVQASEFQTFMAFVTCPTQADRDALTNATAPGIGFSEDWTKSISHYCLRCSYGAPHRHQSDDESQQDWDPDRNLGIAAQSRRSVEKLMKTWCAGGEGRSIDAIETREREVPEITEGGVWWRSPDDTDESE